MKVKTIETFLKGHVALVRVTADDGTQGWGQAAPYNADITTTVLHRQVAPHAFGREIADIGAWANSVVEAEYKFPGSYVCRALAGVETALWDAEGKRRGKSVCALIGGEPRPLLAYGSSMRRDIQPRDEAVRLKGLAASLGYRAFKIRIGSVCGHDRDEWPGRTEALVPAVRDAVGGDIIVLVDGNSCYTPKKAISVGRLLEANSIGHFEEPCPYWELEWTAEVAAALDVPVAGGEQDTDLAQFRRMIGMRAVDVVQPDVCYLGGLARSIAVAGMAEEAGIPCVPHSANRSLVTVFTMHLMTAIPNAGPYVEFSIEPDPWADEIFTPALEVRDGLIPFPEGPGWGVEIRKDWLARAERKETKARS